MDLYRLGPERGPTRIGVARDASVVVSETKAISPPGFSSRTWSLDGGVALLALRVFRVTWQGSASPEGAEWFNMTAAEVDRGLDLAVDQSINITERPPEGWRPNLAAVMLHCRQDIFATTQKAMGAICGRPEVYVSRWEAGVGTPGLEELLRIRAAALSLGLPWDDSEVFEISRMDDVTQQSKGMTDGK